ncbi:uncharacterized protein LOC132921739 [Rhopalosiphum padi]|uniref:uncharacterized protein LOC132921739 n=1 Tax=Rhopalosiphum padi TaxID=40932 RepID=UPI00298E489F|nr:uncharacterized protein LOC132921739 [Rhopalosiphum padi]
MKVDGTFKSAPKLFMQIYTLHCFVMGVMVLMVYAILPNKSNNTNKRMFNIIKEAVLRNDLAFKPKKFEKIQIDFEIGMTVANRDLFGYNTEIKGCLFHFGQSIWRQVQKVGLVHDYTHNDEVKKTVQKICALSANWEHVGK